MLERDQLTLSIRGQCRLLGLARSGVQCPAPAKAIACVKTKAGIILAASQREAVRLALAAKVPVITGALASARRRWSTRS